MIIFFIKNLFWKHHNALEKSRNFGIVMLVNNLGKIMMVGKKFHS
jgi:hypothetical protein